MRTAVTHGSVPHKIHQRQMKKKIRGVPKNGFTIIEVLIVLAIVSLILLVVLLAIPSLNRVNRNSTRRQAIDYVAAQMGQYYADNDHYPLSGATPSKDDRTNFVAGLKASGASKLFAIRYTDESGSHEYPFDIANPLNALDEISIESGHKCNRTPGLVPGDTDYPLQTANGGDANFQAYVIWTQLEGAPPYCVDNAFN